MVPRVCFTRLKNESFLRRFFTSGTTGYPKMAMHSYKYALGHYVTARYWYLCERDGPYFTISETGGTRRSKVSSTASGCAKVRSLSMILTGLTQKRSCAISCKSKKTLVEAYNQNDVHVLSNVTEAIVKCADER